MGPTLHHVKTGRAVTLSAMPGRGYPKVTVRLHGAVLAKLTAAADAAGVDRAVLVRELIHWFLREPGAELPERPAGTDGE